MLCEEIMEKDVEFLSPDASIREAARKMREEGIGFLPVCERSKKVVGTLTDRDIVVRGIAAGCDLDDKVSRVMTEDVVGCQPTDNVRRAEQLMSEHKISRVMCLDDNGRLLGVISLADLAHAEREEGAVKGTVEQIKEGEGPHAQ